MVALTALASRRWRWTALPWLAAGLVFSVLSFGTALRFGEAGVLELPYRYLPQVVPFFLRFHHPYRCLLIAALCFSVCAAMGLDGLRRRLATRRRWWLALAVAMPVLGAVQVFHMVPLPYAELPRPGLAVTQLALERPTGVVMAVHRQSGHHWNDLELDPLLAQLQTDAPVCCLSLPETLWPAQLDQLKRDHPQLGILTGPFSEYDGRELPPDDLTELGFSHVVVYVSDTPASGAQQHRRPAASPASALLGQRFGPPMVEEQLDQALLLVFRLTNAEAADR